MIILIFASRKLSNSSNLVKVSLFLACTWIVTSDIRIYVKLDFKILPLLCSHRWTRSLLQGQRMCDLDQSYYRSLDGFEQGPCFELDPSFSLAELCLLVNKGKQLLKWVCQISQANPCQQIYLFPCFCIHLMWEICNQPRIDSGNMIGISSICSKMTWGGCLSVFHK